jgi:hypothetical protein
MFFNVGAQDMFPSRRALQQGGGGGEGERVLVEKKENDEEEEMVATIEPLWIEEHQPCWHPTVLQGHQHY